MTTPQAPEKIYLKIFNGKDLAYGITLGFESEISSERTDPSDIEYNRSDLVESKPVPGMSLQGGKAQHERQLAMLDHFLNTTPKEELDRIFKEAEESGFGGPTVEEYFESFYAAAQQQQGSKWVSVETLPEENKIVLVCAPKFQIPFTAKYLKIDQRNISENGFYDSLGYIVYPTHWQPLPENPNNK